MDEEAREEETKGQRQADDGQGSKGTKDKVDERQGGRKMMRRRDELGKDKEGVRRGIVAV